MKATKAFEYILQKTGATCRIEAEYECKLVPKKIWADGDEITLSEKELDECGNMTVYIDGKKIDSSRNVNFWRLIDVDFSDDKKIKRIWAFNIGFADQNLIEEYETWLADLIDSGTTDEAKEFIRIEKLKSDLESFNNYLKYVQETENYLKTNNTLMTKEERDKWKQEYNRVVNEGGYGYIPFKPCKEDYEAALKYISEHEELREYCG